jgi:hypothetical protein
MARRLLVLLACLLPSALGVAVWGFTAWRLAAPLIISLKSRMVAMAAVSDRLLVAPALRR